MKYLQMKYLNMNRIFFILIILTVFIFPAFTQENDYINLTSEEITGLWERIYAGEISEDEIQGLKIDLQDKILSGPITEDELEFWVQLNQIEAGTAGKGAGSEEVNSDMAFQATADEFVQEEWEMTAYESESKTGNDLVFTDTEEEIPAQEYIIPQSIRNNSFYRESLRLAQLAQDTYEYGDYEASAGFAEEAILYAQMSDEFVATQLLAEAKRLVEWADFYNIAERNPNNVQLGKDHYENAAALFDDESWNESSDYSIKSIEVLGVLLAGTGATASDRPTISGESLGSIPRSDSDSGTSTVSRGENQYTVRTWAVEKDCFWNIAGYSWVYGDPWRWRVLYEANKNKLPDPNNPDLLLPGTVLDIPR